MLLYFKIKEIFCKPINIYTSFYDVIANGILCLPFLYLSAGVGRTGTYIALDIAFDEAVARGEVNVFDVVKTMRKQRCIMVQTLVGTANKHSQRCMSK